MKSIILIISLMLTASTAQAGFFSNYSTWGVHKTISLKAQQRTGKTEKELFDNTIIGTVNQWMGRWKGTMAEDSFKILNSGRQATAVSLEDALNSQTDEARKAAAWSNLTGLP